MKKVLAFISICYLISGIIGVIIWNIPKSQNTVNPIQLLFTLLLMITPALVAFKVEKRKFLVTSEKFQLNFKNINWKQTFKYLLITNLLLPVLVMFYGYLFGNVLEIEPFGKLITSYRQLSPEILQKIPSILKIDYLLFLLVPLMFIASLMSSISINGFIALGEEIGWRGFLEKNLNFSFFKKNIIIGIIWGVWHTPIIISGHNYPNHPYWGILMMVILCIAMSFYFSFALKRTQSLFVIGALHGGINAVEQTLAFIQIDYNDLFGPIGLLMFFSVLTVFLIDYTLSKKTNEPLHFIS